MSTTVDPYAAVNASSSGSSTTSSSSDAGSADRFLKLLVTQLQNQDPLNPMDNAEITSQMAQINTVSGIQTLNTSVQALQAQFLQMQTLQGAALVGRDVTVEGNRLAFYSDGTGVGGFSLAAAADSVKVEVLDASGRVADTLQLGAQDTGLGSFLWTPPDGTAAGDYTFRVSAVAGSAAVEATPLMRDAVAAVHTDSEGLVLELATSGSVRYDAVKAFN